MRTGTGRGRDITQASTSSGAKRAKPISRALIMIVELQ
jgi:hypothetical protein